MVCTKYPLRRLQPVEEDIVADIREQAERVRRAQTRLDDLIREARARTPAIPFEALEDATRYGRKWLSRVAEGYQRKRN